MDLALLQDFVELASELNFSRAADRRNMTQPAFSRRIRGLEDAIGTPLVQRTSRSVSLTPAGSAFLPRANARVRLVAEVRRDALEAAAYKSRFSVGVLIQLDRLLTVELIPIAAERDHKHVHPSRQ